MRRYTIRQFEAQFPDDKACLAYLFKARWPQGVTCARCERVSKHFPRSTQRAYSCMLCGTLVFPTAGTIFHKSPTPLRLWFYAMFIMASTRCGVSAKQLERELGVTYKTAWRMFKQIRMLMEEDAHDLSGPVEMDESYFGGFKAPKTVVAGIVERRGRVTARVTTDVKARTLLPLLWKRVKAYEQQVVYTDELASYNRLAKLGYQHATVRHRANVYVSGDVHVNTIEGFWSLVKNGIRGVYHAVGSHYLQTYLDEYVFRYNHRKDQESDVRDADGAGSGRGCAARRSKRWNAERVRGSSAMSPSYHNLSTVPEGIVTRADVFIEMGKAQAPTLTSAIASTGGSVLGKWRITYYRKHPALLYRARWQHGAVMDTLELDGMDDDHTPLAAIRACSQPLDVVFDPCTGRGLTAVSADIAGRVFYGAELNPRRLAVTIDKLVKRGHTAARIA